MTDAERVVEALRERAEFVVRGGAVRVGKDDVQRHLESDALADFVEAADKLASHTHVIAFKERTRRARQRAYDAALKRLAEVLL